MTSDQTTPTAPEPLEDLGLVLHSEYVFNVKDIKALIDQADDSGLISIKISYARDDSFASNKIFRTRVTAEVEPANNTGAQSYPTDDGAQTSPNQPLPVHALMATTQRAEGCPRPPGCSS